MKSFHRSFSPAWGALLLLFSWSSLAAAQVDLDEAPAEDAPTEESAGGGLYDLDGESGDEAAEEGEDPQEEGSSDSAKKKKKKKDGKTQLLMGLRYRMLITPKFLINMFGVDGGRTVALHGVGPEIGGYWGKRDDGFMVFFSPWYAGYGLEQTPFKGKNDDASAWEVIESDMKMWYLTVDALWDHKIVDRFSFNIGLGVGLGIVGGQLRRNEAYIDNADPSIPADKDWPNLSLCQGPGNPNPTECPADGNYDIITGGSSDRWPVYPWINFQAGLRYQPVDEFIGRFEIGLGSSGFWLGIAGDYSLFL